MSQVPESNGVATSFRHIPTNNRQRRDEDVESMDMLSIAEICFEGSVSAAQLE
jgi:hypothetical protein